jgi:NADH-quinone oxidoreductase subunit J
MNFAFYFAAAIALFSTLMVITRLNAVHALLYLILSLLSVGTVFYTLGAPYVAVLEVIIYAGAIMVLFVFVVMMLNLGPESVEQERAWLTPRMWILPSILAIFLILELGSILVEETLSRATGMIITPKQVSMALFGPYLIGVELASLLLLAGLVGAYHLGRREKSLQGGD